MNTDEANQFEALRKQAEERFQGGLYRLAYQTLGQMRRYSPSVKSRRHVEQAIRIVTLFERIHEIRKHVESTLNEFAELVNQANLALDEARRNGNDLFGTETIDGQTEKQRPPHRNNREDLHGISPDGD